jgi:hypothetical protein
MEPTRKKAKRVQLTAAEKEVFLEKIRSDSSAENLQALLDGWNRDHPDRQIIPTHLTRLVEVERSTGNQSPEDFWRDIRAAVAAETDAAKWEVPTGGRDHTGRQTLPVDADKVPEISAAELEELRFPFDLPKYNRCGTPKEHDASQKLLRRDFRAHMAAKGIAFGRFDRFVSADEREHLGSDDWAPGGEVWRTVGKVVMKDAALHKTMTDSGPTFSDVGKTATRIHPKHGVVKRHLAEHKPELSESLARVLEVTEALYRSVAKLVTTPDRVDSRWQRQYRLVADMMPDWLSFLTCIRCPPGIRRAQREHMDDHEPGLSGLWGLAPKQFVIVWKGSFEANLELERLHDLYYEFVVAQKPAGWSDQAFWNLVANVHLRRLRPKYTVSPVKVPLPVGDLLLFDFLVVHAGMPAFPRLLSLRGHLYWPRIAGRDGESPDDLTCFPWGTYHRYYPAWRVIAKGRAAFE